MNIILHNIQQSQLPLIQELAKVLGISIEKQEINDSSSNEIQEDDVTFNREMKSRFDDLETGKVKGYSWDEVKAAARKSSKMQLSSKITFHQRLWKNLPNRLTGMKNKRPALARILSLKLSAH